MSRSYILITDLEPGWRFPAMELELGKEAVWRYIASLDDLASKRPSIVSKYVPPSAVLAFAFSRCLEVVRLPPHALHVGQEFRISEPVEVGAVVDIEAVIAGVIVKRDFRLYQIGVIARDKAGFDKMDGVATIWIP